jgi:hypothetical protein
MAVLSHPNQFEQLGASRPKAALRNPVKKKNQSKLVESESPLKH